MQKNLLPSFIGASLVAGILVSAGIRSALRATAQPPKTDDDLSADYGFNALEIFKLERRSSNMLTGDLNHDGLADLLLVDNSHSRLDLLLQRKQKPAKNGADRPKAAVNSVENDWRFEHRKVPVDKQVAAVTLGDFDGDGRTDIAYFGVPDRLVIRYQPESGDWTRRTDLRLPDVSAIAWNMAAGDLNHDKKDDLVVLGKNETYLVYQQNGGKLGSPVRLMNTSERLGLVQIADLDGDGRNDLCYLANDTEGRVLCSRLQDNEGRLGPELRFELNQPRGISLADIDGKPGQEILAIDSRTGRVRVSSLRRPAAKSGELAGRLIQYGFGRGSGRDRDLATGDLDGDGLTDLVVTDPESAQMLVFRQRKNQGLDMGVPFPGLVGAEHVRVGDFDGDKSAEVVVLSNKEKTLGISKFEGKRLTFPETLPTVNEPVVLELADLDGDGRPEIVYVSRQREGRSSLYTLRALGKAKDGTWQPRTFAKQESVPLDLKGPPKRMVTLDADRNGRPDFLLFPGLDRAPILYSTGEDGVPVEVKSSGGIGIGDVSPGAVFIGPQDNPLVLIGRENFARNMQLEKNGSWKVIDQYNASETNATIAGAAALDLDGRPGDEIVLVDTGVKKLRVYRQVGNVHRPWREVEMGTFPFKSATVSDLNGDGKNDLLLFGGSKFAVLYAGRTDPTLKEVASFETKLDKVFFSDVVAGDLNGNGSADLAVVDTRSHYIELLNFDPKLGLRHALHFKLFEGKNFSSTAERGSEPREVLIADVTGDGLDDLVLLIHDRVLVFPQDDG